MISGILLIDKPEGITSFEVVRRTRRALNLRKIGHLGTLDPFATGLLPLCLGEATKLAPYLLPGPKSYRATLKLGEATDTQDLTGRVVSRTEKLPLPEEVRRLAATLVGEILQTPPMYSALHYKGERLYRLARRGETVELPPRAVTIYRLEVEKMEMPRVTFTVQCSQGTFIRTLAADLGALLECGAHLETLRRLQVGAFRVEEALTLAALEEAAAAGRDAPAALAEMLVARIIRLSSCLPGVKQVAASPGEAAKLRQGQEIIRPPEDFTPEELVQILAAGQLLALARVRLRGAGVVLAPIRVFAAITEGAARDQNGDGTCGAGIEAGERKNL
ncbi:MAG: tRNA pseudouridine(55) synthase TruB [Desulfobaccales bacterium]|jgi:tRNA pseudouridine55 synthase